MEKLIICAITAVLLSACGGVSEGLAGTDAGTDSDSFGEDSGSTTNDSEGTGGSTTGSDSGASCGIEGEQVSCPCPGGLEDGVQVCQANGAYSACMGCDTGSTSTTGSTSSTSGMGSTGGSTGEGSTGSTSGDTGGSTTGSTGGSSTGAESTGGSSGGAVGWPDEGQYSGPCNTLVDCPADAFGCYGKTCIHACTNVNDCDPAPEGSSAPVCFSDPNAGLFCALDCSQAADDCPSGMICQIGDSICAWP